MGNHQVSQCLSITMTYLSAGKLEIPKFRHNKPQVFLQ